MDPVSVTRILRDISDGAYSVLRLIFFDTVSTCPMKRTQGFNGSKQLLTYSILMLYRNVHSYSSLPTEMSHNPIWFHESRKIMNTRSSCIHYYSTFMKPELLTLMGLCDISDVLL